jgi:uncharacterized protein
VPSVTPLLVDVYELARERRTIDGAFALVDLKRLAASLLRTEGSLQYRIRGEFDQQGRPGAEMHLSATLWLECQRCNQALDFPLQRNAHFRFVSSEEELNALPIDDDDVDEVVGSRHMDIAVWIEDEAILSLPLVPRHDNCRPAALHVGAPEGDDGGERRPNPFAALASLKAGRKPG